MAPVRHPARLSALGAHSPKGLIHLWLNLNQLDFSPTRLRPRVRNSLCGFLRARTRRRDVFVSCMRLQTRMPNIIGVVRHNGSACARACKRTPSFRLPKNFTVVFYGLKIFVCKTAQLSETRRRSDSLGLPMKNTLCKTTQNVLYQQEIRFPYGQAPRLQVRPFAAEGRVHRSYGVRSGEDCKLRGIPRFESGGAASNGGLG